MKHLTGGMTERLECTVCGRRWVIAAEAEHVLVSCPSCKRKYDLILGDGPGDTTWWVPLDE